MADHDRTSVPLDPHPGPELIRAPGFADLLSVIPSLVGVHPKDSLVIVPFLGRRAVGGFRVALPGRLGESETAALAGACIQAFTAVPEADAVLVVVYSERSYAEERGIPLAALGRAVVRRLERTRHGIVGVACVASDGWGRYTIAAERRSPRRLDEIHGSESGLFSRAVADEPLDVAEQAVLPVVEEDDRAVVAAVLAHGPVGQIAGLTPVIERWLAGPSVARREGRIVQFLQSPPLRDQLALQIALGPIGAAPALVRMIREQAEQALTGETMEALVERHDALRLPGDDDLAEVELLMGVGPGPDPARLALATRALARTAALAPVEARAPVLTVLAWCWWARGAASLAAAHLAEARRLDPDYSMALLYESLFSARSVPDWVLESTSRRLVSAAALP
ncbi:DUF4192 family protein [Rathayibacter sp. Leaf248]|uniref:DUF4192 family protein n=1 Tax=Rathayibacter sp. Leaf248 TaxID=2876555 RepID=UPI001E2BACAD|nr:DUF4192 family protein [Rathayibacter sp. Leaf248]